MGTCSVIVGPRTRLGRELSRVLPGPASERYLVARDPHEAALLRDLDPGAVVVHAWETQSGLPSGCAKVAVYVCALGPIHPGDPDFAIDAERATGDLRFLSTLLAQLRESEVHLVFVSSVLARVGARTSRCYYAGFKNVVEGLLAGMVATHGRGLMSVLHPGRLLDSRSIRWPMSLLRTPYHRLAQKLLRVTSRGRARRITIGPDARLLTVARALAETWRAITSY